jgi:DNA-binding LacI/PurR family transcriptional regulator
MTTAEYLRVAAEAQVDVRTVRRFVAGEKVRPALAERIEAAMAKLRIKHTQGEAAHGNR